ncbi:hypothetical protein CYMTET_23970 [Cymbomonas tetramitiformis]|uniref:C2H2-type domain-containing protein n=1 Tax=Cymbomonas tetramitiformis TaxID=36881 RepID=A0AAE0FWQ8_9CHLO|nr:hypothetical protein CYMTET_23970 [Cymbomonas tetramitiformis]
MSLFQPIGQKRLTNIAVVRYKKGGKRFEIACYKNTVGAWRSGAEKDINEVLQTTTVFDNVSKGVVAKKDLLKKVFGTADEEAVCRKILEEGAMQVSDKEREMHFDNLYRDVANVLVEKCVNPENGRPYPLELLERSLKDVHFSVDPNKTAKQQALDFLPQLQKSIPIERAWMRLSIQVSQSAQDALLGELQAMKSRVESKKTEASRLFVTCALEPSCFRRCDQFVRSLPEGGGQLEVVALAIQGSSSMPEIFDVARPSDTSDATARVCSDSRQGNVASQAEPRPVPAPAVKSGGRVFKCNTCGVEYTVANEHREHYKSKWHSFNQKLKSKGLPAVSEAEFDMDPLMGEEKNDLDEF